MSYRPTVLEINLQNLEDNLHYMQSIHPDKSILAVLKANAYGAGDIQVAKIAQKAGCVYAAVSSLDEAIVLRHKGITLPILTLGYTNSDWFTVAQKYDITLSVSSLAHAKMMAESAVNGLKLHFQVDTGMNRLGFKNLEELKEAVSLLKDKHTVEGIYTHFFMAEEESNPRTKEQYRLFMETVKALNYPFKWVHIANSSSILNGNNDSTNLVRAGIVMYGIQDVRDSHLKEVLSLKTAVTLCKKVHKGETVSYGATYTLEEDGWICTLPIGYADGFIRHNSGRKVYIDGEYAPLVGRICMDQCMILTSREYPVDTPVEIFGEHISIYDMAKELDTIPYEIITNTNPRVTRQYLYNNEVVEERNDILIQKL